VLTHEVDALLVPPGDADALAAAIARLLGDRRAGRPARRGGAGPRARVRMGHAGRTARGAVRAGDRMISERLLSIVRCPDCGGTLELGGMDAAAGPLRESVRRVGGRS
jgi:hypothetical protein